jgi:nucleoside-diphosphate-sugar epimerase
MHEPPSIRLKQARSSGMSCGGLDVTTRVPATEGAGFIGSSLVRTLFEKSYKATILGNMSVGLRDNFPRNSKLRLVTGNSRDFELLSTVISGHSHVIHLAAQAFIPLPMRAHTKAG